MVEVKFNAADLQSLAQRIAHYLSTLPYDWNVDVELRHYPDNKLKPILAQRFGIWHMVADGANIRIEPESDQNWALYLDLDDEGMPVLQVMKRRDEPTLLDVEVEDMCDDLDGSQWKQVRIRAIKGE